MAGTEAIPLKVEPTKYLKKGQLAKDIVHVAEEDATRVLRGIAGQEIANQIRLGNKPTNVLVDNRKGKKITDAMYSVKVNFYTAEDMLKALKEAWDIMQRLMLRVSGETASHLQVWQGNANTAPKQAGNSPSAISLSSLKPGVGVYIVGPMAPNTRKFRWLTTGKRSFKASRRAELKGLKARDKPKVPHSIHEMTIRMMRQKYPQLKFVDAWVSVPSLTPNARNKRNNVNRVPTVAIWAKSKGKI